MATKKGTGKGGPDGTSSDGASGRQITYAEAIREGFDQAMDKDPKVFLIGEGIPDPGRVFGTTKDLLEKYGPGRVMDMPVAENAMTGICIGAAIRGYRPVITHQRLDFVLLSLDQVINNAAKWHYMFGGKDKVPIVIRMIIGQGWGQGAQHSQNLQALFAHIPGLKVVMPATAYEAKGLLMAAIEDDNPVVFIEHRWLHNISDFVPEKPYSLPLGKSVVMQEGSDITFVTTSFMAVEAMKARIFLQKAGIAAEIVNVQTLKPFDDAPILDSVRKTGFLLAIDSGYYTGGFAGEVIARVSEKVALTARPARITLPDFPTPTTASLAQYYYPTYKDIVRKACQMLSRSRDADAFLAQVREENPPDVPDKSFTGPF